MARQVARSGFADVANSECVNETLERRAASLRQRCHQIRSGLASHPVESGDGIDVQPEQISRRMDQARVHQLVDNLVTQPFDVERAPAGKVQQRLLALCAAHESAGAACHRLALLAIHMRRAHRAAHRHLEYLRVTRTAVGNDRDHLGNHVAGTPDDDGVANANVLAANLVLVMQRRVGHCHSADEHRSEPCHRRQRPGAADLDIDAEHLRDCFLRRKLVSNREARRARHVSELLLIGTRIDPVDNAVDFVRQRGAPLAD